MEYQKTPKKEFNFKLKLSFLLPSFIFLQGLSIIIGVIFWRQGSTEGVYTVGFVMLLFCLLILLHLRSKRKIKLNDDHIELPVSTFGSKSITIKYIDIKEVHWHSSQSSNVFLTLYDGSSHRIDSMFVEHNDMVEIVEYIEQVIPSNEESKSELSKNKKSIFIKNSALVIPATLFVFKRYREGNLYSESGIIMSCGNISII